MALITCMECGKEFSDKAPACPNCGCPTGDLLSGNDSSHPESKNDSISLKAFNIIKSGANTLTYHQKEFITCTKKIGSVQIDEKHNMFRITGSVPVNEKKHGFVKLFKGIMAVGTLGTSVAAEKLISDPQKNWLSFSDLLNYELLEDDSTIVSGGVGQALIGGMLFGGVGAITGGIIATRKQKKKVESLIIKVTLNNFKYPCLMVPLITKPTKKASKEYQSAFNKAHQILSALDVIAHNK